MGSDYTGKFRLYRKSDWAKLPAMRWLIKSLIVRHGTTILYGQPKIGKKSFIGISMACAIATGKLWCGFATQQAKVLYVVGEGFYGILRRQAAWEKLHGCLAGDDLRYFRVPINFFNELEVDVGLKALKDQGFEPDFIVIDTLARSMSGGNENDTGDMSVVFNMIEKFRTCLNDTESNAGILLIHHTTKDGFNYRGSSVQGGAVDGLIESKSEGLLISLTSHGFKDAEEFEPFTVRCESTAVETDEGWQDVLVVKDIAEVTAADILNRPADWVSPAAEKLLAVLAQFPGGATSTKWRKASGLPNTTFKKYRKELETAKRITGGGDRDAKYHVGAQPKPENGEGSGSSLGSGLGSGPSPFRGDRPNRPYQVGPDRPYFGP